MKKLLLSLAMSGLVFFGFAQQKKDVNVRDKKTLEHRMPKGGLYEKKSPEEIAKLKTDQLDGKLKFTDKQRKEVYALQLKQAKKDKVFFAEQRKVQEKAMKERKADREKMLNVLTPEQRELLKNSFAENRKMPREQFKKEGERKKRSFDNEGGRRIKSQSVEQKAS